MAIDKNALMVSVKRVERDCPKAGGRVTIRRLTAGEFVRVTKDAGEDLGFRLVAACVVDEAGIPLFNGDQVQDLGADVFLALSELVHEVNGLADASKKSDSQA